MRSKRNLSFDPVNRFVHESFGWNSRLSGIASALGISQLMRIGEMLEKKQLLAKRYLESLKNHPWIDLPLTEYKGTINKYWVFGVIFHEGSPLDGTSASNLLREKSVETRRFFCPMHLQPVMRNVNYEKIGSMKVSERLWERGIYLPMGGGITLDEVDRVCEALWSLI